MLAVHNAAYPKSQSENQAPPPPPKKVKMAKNPVDLPMFSLSGLSETKPMEREGWFTNKISQLKQSATVSCQGINRPKQEFKDTAQLPPGWMKLTEENGGQVWYVSPEGVRCGTLGLAFKYLERQFALTSTMRRRRRRKF